ncbi:MAG: NUDIX hydrolase, partial [Deltaproteobacteria bacterium]
MAEPRASCVASRLIYRGHTITLSVDRVRLPGGHITELDIVRHPGAAAVVPIDARGDVWLVRQVRYAAEGALLE